MAMAEGGTAAGGVMDVNTTLQEVWKTGLIHDGLTWNSRSCQSLDKGQNHLSELASICDDPVYVKLVEAPNHPH